MMKLWQRARGYYAGLDDLNKFYLTVIQTWALACLFGVLVWTTIALQDARSATRKQAERVISIMEACNNKDQSVFVEGDFYYKCLLGAQYNEADIRNKMYKEVQSFQLSSPIPQVSSVP